MPSEIAFSTKPQIAVALLAGALADEVVPAPVLADSAYGESSNFRAELCRLGLEFFLQVTGSAHKGWTEPVATERKFKRRYVKAGAPASRMLEQIVQVWPKEVWRSGSWKTAEGKTRHTRLAWSEIYLAHGLRWRGRTGKSVAGSGLANGR